MRKILVIDDEYQEDVIEPLQEMLSEREEMEYIGRPNVEDGIETISKCKPDIVLLDLLFPGDEDFMSCQGLQALDKLREMRREMRKEGKAIPPIVMLTKVDAPSIIEMAYAKGAIFFLAKTDIEEIEKEEEKEKVYQTIIDAHNWGVAEAAKAKRWFEREKLEIEVPNKEPVVIIGNSEAMQKIYDQIEEAAKSDRPVMIYGETGTGKELVARAIHYHPENERRDCPFIPHNMAVLSGDRGLIQAELFGCPMNSPNVGDFSQLGIFQKACNMEYRPLPADVDPKEMGRPAAVAVGSPGSLFLDEIGRTPYDAQAMLLRTVEEGLAAELGGRNKYEANPRLICATNEDLYKLSAVGDGGNRVFRQDLLNRLEVIRIDVPSLNEHIEDIEPLVEHFIEKENSDYGKNVQYVLPSTWKLLEQPIWENANIRKLGILIRDCVRSSEGQVLRLSDQTIKYLEQAAKKEGEGDRST